MIHHVKQDREERKLLAQLQRQFKDDCKVVRTELKRIVNIKEEERTEEDKKFVLEHNEEYDRVTKSKQKAVQLQRRKSEQEDGYEDIEEKCQQLSDMIRGSSCTVVYTGAGVSTAASIPDYRGENGVWTKLEKGEQLGSYDLSQAMPTYTHMALMTLVKCGKVQYIVSQNCDGLHLRSGIEPENLSEIHGNMYAEVCIYCKPHVVYYRLFDVTETTALRRHKTGRKCHICENELVDSIVHFGEKRDLDKPQNWAKAGGYADKADLIICLGSSLKVLKSYHCLWAMDKVKAKRPKLCIVNLQWTPKDKLATLKINGRCDEVMQKVLSNLQISPEVYSLTNDPLRHFQTPLHADEVQSHTTSFVPLTPLQGSLTPVDESCTSDLKTETLANRLCKDGNNIRCDDGGEQSEKIVKVITPAWFGKGRKKGSRAFSGKRRRRSLDW